MFKILRRFFKLRTFLYENNQDFSNSKQQQLNTSLSNEGKIKRGDGFIRLCKWGIQDGLISGIPESRNPGDDVRRSFFCSILLFSICDVLIFKQGSALQQACGYQKPQGNIIMAHYPKGGQAFSHQPYSRYQSRLCHFFTPNYHCSQGYTLLVQSLGYVIIS